MNFPEVRPDLDGTILPIDAVLAVLRDDDGDAMALVTLTGPLLTGDDGADLGPNGPDHEVRLAFTADALQLLINHLASSLPEWHKHVADQGWAVLT